MKTPTKVTLISIAVVAVLVVAGFIFTSASSPNVSNDPVAAAAIPDDGGLPGVAANSHVLDEVGPDAPTLVEYLDFECEACGAFFPIVEEVRAKYAGEVTFIARYFPLPSHFNSVRAARTVESAARQGEFEAMYKKMYETQKSWGEAKVPKDDLFRSFAEEIGLDMKQFDADYASDEVAQRVQRDVDDGTSLGVAGTPTFYIDGKLFEPKSVQDFYTTIDEALGK